MAKITIVAGRSNMPDTDHAGVRGVAIVSRNIAQQALVMGLHWDPPREGSDDPSTDLDALCTLYDAQNQVLEVIHPGHTRGAEGSVIHTGDSKTGASTWDDERIFVFLQGLPAQVSKLAFVVASTSGRPFDAVRGAICHLSDHDDDSELLRIDLTTLVGKRSHTVAIVRRGPAGWHLGGGCKDFCVDR